MKWLEIIISVVEIVLPFLAKIRKKRVEKELEVVTTGIEKFSKYEDPVDKGKLLKGMIRTLAQESGIEKRLQKKIKKFEGRLWKKIF